jgi:hypothetical protein
VIVAPALQLPMPSHEVCVDALLLVAPSLQVAALQTVPDA